MWQSDRRQAIAKLIGQNKKETLQKKVMGIIKKWKL